MLTLAERCEAATADQQAELLEEAFRLINPTPRQMYCKGQLTRPWVEWRHRFDLFTDMLACEAYESAAMTLVPEGWDRWIYDADDGRCICRLDRTDESLPELELGASALTWPLALCAAALKARASQKETDNGQ